MARQVRSDIEYFSFDVNFFDDPKLLFVSSRFEEKGEIIVVKLLCWIYKNEGYYTLWNDEISMLFAKRAFVNIKYTLVNDVVNELIKRNFFNEDLFNKFGILTSSGIQKRWLEATKRRKVSIKDDYDLVNKCVNSDTGSTVKYTESTLNNTLMTSNHTQIPQSKVKESKVKKIKEGSPKSPTDLIIERMSKYAAQCIDDRRWVEEVCMNVGLSSIESEKSRFKIRLWKFCKHLGTIGNEHPNLVEFKKHFISWLRLNSKKSNPVKTTPAEWLA